MGCRKHLTQKETLELILFDISQISNEMLIHMGNMQPEICTMTGIDKNLYAGLSTLMTDITKRFSFLRKKSLDLHDYERDLIIATIGLYQNFGNNEDTYNVQSLNRILENISRIKDELGYVKDVLR